jgi:hypothetical protein
VEDSEIFQVPDADVGCRLPLSLSRVGDMDNRSSPLNGARADQWKSAGAEGITETQASDLLALDVAEVTMSLAMNGSTPAAILATIFERGGSAAVAVLTNRSSPPELKALAPLGSHSDESVWRFAQAQHATDTQLRALLDELDRSPRPGGPPLGDVWREVVRKHPRLSGSFKNG